MRILALVKRSDDPASARAWRELCATSHEVVALSDKPMSDDVVHCFDDVWTTKSRHDLPVRNKTIWSGRTGTVREKVPLPIKGALFDTIHITATVKGSGSLAVSVRSRSKGLGKVNIPFKGKGWNTVRAPIKIGRAVFGREMEFTLTSLEGKAITIGRIEVGLSLNASPKSIAALMNNFRFDSLAVDNLPDNRSFSNTVKTISIFKTHEFRVSGRTLIAPKKKPKVSILTPTLNGKDIIEKCAAHLYRNTDPDLFEWLVLDDGSTDGTDTLFGTKLRKHSNITYVNTHVRNFSKANNILAERARGEYLMFLNNDCYLQRHAVENLIRSLEADPAVGMAGGLLLFPDSKTIQHCGVIFVDIDNFGPLPGHYLHRQPLEPHQNFVYRPRLFQAVTAACAMMPKALYDRLGGFDESYEFGYEDVDLCLKIGENGYKVLFTPEAVAYHEQGATLDEPSKKHEKHAKYLNNKKILQMKWAHSPVTDGDSYSRNNMFNVYSPKDPGTVAYVPASRGHGHDIYRTDHAVEALKKAGVKACVIDWRNPVWPSNVGAVVMQRFTVREPQKHFYRELRSRYSDAVFGYDIDDYIFDEAVAKNAKVERSIITDASLYKHFMKDFDFFTTTTEFLADILARTFSKPTFVIPNAVGSEFRRVYSPAKNGLTIGYASGTPTHDRDFESILPVLRTILKERPDVTLKIMGYLKLPKHFLARFKNQIERHDFVPFSEFPEILSSVDVSLCPLEMTEFNQAKSPLKYIEAAILGIPTIASATAGYKEVVTDGFNGLLCHSAEEWESKIRMLLNNPVVRKRLASNAQRNVENRYTTDVSGAYLNKVIRGMAMPGYSLR